MISSDLSRLALRTLLKGPPVFKSRFIAGSSHRKIFYLAISISDDLSCFN